ncbi:MAG: hypothetical protein V7703_19930 [Hyphomicrobiales bacterium]
MESEECGVAGFVLRKFFSGTLIQGCWHIGFLHFFRGAKNDFQSVGWTVVRVFWLGFELGTLVPGKLYRSDVRPEFLCSPGECLKNAPLAKML